MRLDELEQFAELPIPYGRNPETRFNCVNNLLHFPRNLCSIPHVSSPRENS